MADKPIHFDNQKERWLKYGVNVVVASIVVILLAWVIVYLAQHTNRRWDTTATSAYSLKPQTLNILKDVKAKTKLVSLYRTEAFDPKTHEMKQSPEAEAVADLLDEYRRDCNNIDVDVIDPDKNNAKVEALISDVSKKYGGETKKYEDLIAAYAPAYDKIKGLAADQVKAVANFPKDKYPQDDLGQNEEAAVEQGQILIKKLNASDEKIKRLHGDKPPDYVGIKEEIADQTQYLSEVSKQINDIFAKGKGDKRLPDEIRQYMTNAPAMYTQIGKIADDLNKKTKDLGALKLDDLRTSLKAKDCVLVIGDTDMRVIPKDQMWKADMEKLRQYTQGEEIKEKFAGEQAISTALLALNQNKKPKVCFLRAGGAPLTSQGSFFGRGGGPFSEVAARLRDYNFDVSEKDLTGMYAMQAQMQQQPAEPEPTDDQIKDAIWVVINSPTQENPMGGPPPSINAKVADHLNAGGSALILNNLRADNLTDVLKPWGIELHNDAVDVHEPIKAPEGSRKGDMVDEASKLPFIFDLRDYGDHPIVRPLRSLRSMLLPLLALKVNKVAGVTTTPIIPLPSNMKTWGETNLESFQDMSTLKYDQGTDIAPPLYGGAVAEKDKGGRLVVIASLQFAVDQYLNEPDPQLLAQRIFAARFPANGELFQNSIFWLAKMEPMIAISPAAMEVARIEPMSEGAKNFWKTGMLLIILPGLVVVAGAMVYFMRQD